MIPIPAHLINQYTTFIDHRSVQTSRQQYYVKWLRYYLDFCHKYNFLQDAKESLSAFVKKLREKKQSEEQRKQAHHAISLYYEMALHLKRKAPNNLSRDNGTVANQSLCKAPSSTHTKQNSFYQENQSDDTKALQNVGPTPCAEEVLKQSGADWTGVFNDLKNAIKIRHYSPATLRTYSGWTRKFQAYTKSKDPRLLTIDEVRAFLTWLAVDQGVSASSQNQAFNALLFLFRHVFGKEFGKVADDYDLYAYGKECYH